MGDSLTEAAVQWTAEPGGCVALPDAALAAHLDLPCLAYLRRVALEHGGNPLIGAAQGLLEIGASLRRDVAGSGEHAGLDEFTGFTNVTVSAKSADPPGANPLPLEPLRTRLVAMVETFAQDAMRRGVDAETLALSRYCLCTYLDETIAGTSWGGGAWAAKSLLVIFHGEASGGERFFTILHGLTREPARHIDALEFIDAMLALGMAGRYRLIEGGAAQLQRVREKLRELIRAQRGAPPRALSDDWQPAGAHPRPWWRVRALGLSVMASVVALAILWIGLDRSLTRQAKPVADALNAIRLPDAQQGGVAVRAAPASALPGGLQRKLLTLLAPEIARQRVSVDGAADRAEITLPSDGIFASGSAKVLPPYTALIERIGAALNDVPGRVVVVGHTDDRPPVPGARSNWQLSLARASEVVDLLRAKAVRPERFLAQGRGALDAVAPNDSPAARARNRRVVIAVLVPGASL